MGYLKKLLISKPHIIVYLIFFIIAILSFLVASMVKPSMKNIFYSIGVVFLTLFIADLIWQLINGGKPYTKHIVELKRILNLKLMGIQEAFPNRASSWFISEYGKWDTLLDYRLNRQMSEIDIIGINLDGIFDLKKIPDNIDLSKINFNSSNYPRITKLLKRIKNGTVVNIVLPNSNSSYLKLRAETEKIDAPLQRWSTRLKTNIDVLLHIKNKMIPAECKNNLQITLTDNIIYYFMFRSDDVMIVSNYLAHSKGDNCPAIVLRKVDKIKIEKNTYESWFSLYEEDFKEYVKNGQVL